MFLVSPCLCASVARDAKMIAILNGALGVGKTEVAWKLIEKFDRAIMLDGDYKPGFSALDFDSIGKGETRFLFVDHFFIRRR
jgi:hypothetical protein